YPLTIVRFLCYSVHGELLCGGWFVDTPILPLEFSFFFPFLLPMYYISTARRLRRFSNIFRVGSGRWAAYYPLTAQL
ncbi:MAG: hypothetical protein MRZ98_02845, partial [Clostridiales bacterium]|nr:hypothetical protein [Clostridiales bacterium]